MSITLNGTTGIAGVDGTAATPAVQGGDSNTGVFFPAADTVAVTTGGSERMRVDSSGNVGIGTSSPSKLLHTYRNNTDQSAQVQVEQAGSGSPTLGFLKTGVYAWMTGLYNSDNSYRIAASGTDLNTTTRLTIDTSGNVGIGTSSPSYRVDVASADTTAGAGYAVRIRANATATAGALQFTDSTASTQNGIIAVYTSSNMKFTTSLTERLRIASAGQIGIGGANYGTSGQVLTSGGSGAAPSWTSRGFASATLTDKTSVRANGTTYQNTTTGWLFVSVRDSNNGQAFTAGPSSASLNIFNTNIAPGTAIALVPPSYYYACSGSVLQSWYEGQA